MEEDNAAALDLGIVMEGTAAEHVAARNCHLYNVGNLNSRQFALAFSKSESVNDFPQLCSITA